jgi:hypothetical protein
VWGQIKLSFPARVAELLRPAPALLATSVFEIISAEGFPGSYATVARHLRDLRGSPYLRASIDASTHTALVLSRR